MYGQVVKLRVVATDCGRPPLSTTLNLSLVVNRTLDQGAGDIYSPYNDDTATDGDPTNVLLVGAACGSGLVMLTAIVTGLVFALRSQHGRRHADAVCCYCCCADNHGPLHQHSTQLIYTGFSLLDHAIYESISNRYDLL